MSSAQDSTPPEELARQRVPLERKVSLKFKEFRGFITEYAANISLGGMFIRSEAPKPPGTRFDFELGLEDDFTLLQGIGEVAWVRERDEGAGRPAGMGVRFLDLEPDSEQLIVKMVEQHVQSGGTPFDLEAEHGDRDGEPLVAGSSEPVDPTSKTVSLGWGQLGPSRVTYAQAATGSEGGSGPRGAGSGAEPKAGRAGRGKEPPFGARVEDLLGGPQRPETVREAMLPGEPGRDDDTRASGPTREERLPAGVEEVARAFQSSATGSPARSQSPPENASTPSAPVASHRRGTPPSSEPAPAEQPTASLEIPHPSSPPQGASFLKPSHPPLKPLPWETGEPESHPSEAVEPEPFDLEPDDQEHLAPDPYRSHQERPTTAHDLGYGSPVKPRSKARPVLVALGLLLLLGAAATFLVLDGRVPLPEPVASWLPGREAPPRAPDLGGLPPAEGRPAAGASFERHSTEAEPVPPTLPEVTEEPEPVSPSPLTRLEDVQWERTEGGTVVVLVADGGFREGVIRQFRLGGESTREVVRILGVQQPFGRATTQVGTGQVAQVRIGHHAGNELHVVLDLTGPGVSLERTEARGHRLLLYLVGG